MIMCRAQELVQVESLAQVGVQLLLFTLGLEFSLSKLRAVRSVALLGERSILVSFEASLLPVSARCLPCVAAERGHSPVLATSSYLPNGESVC